MKYIRTKDGIYKVDESTLLTSMPPCYKVIEPIDKHYAISERNVVAMNDTIAELCDEFVVIFPDGTWETYKMFRVIEDCLKMDYYKGCKYYGAIWTDKGLIYVAKMNDKGELELL